MAARVSDYEEITEEERQELLDHEARRHYSSMVDAKIGYRNPRETARNVEFNSPVRADTPVGGRDLTDSMSVLETPTTYAINVCREKVIRPYRKLLLLVGWEPLFEDSGTRWRKALNITHPLLVMLLVFLGYIIQYSSCFRRDNPPPAKMLPAFPGNGTSPPAPPATPSFSTCYGRLVSQYVIPDLFHSLAYLYSFWIMRVNQSENLYSLVIKTFLQTSPTQAGVWSQRKLIRAMRAGLYLCVLWLALSLVCQILHVVATYEEIKFKWFHADSEFGKVLLVIFMLLSIMFLSVVYVLVVLNYCCQCMLLTFYIEGLLEKLTRGEFKLIRGMQEIYEIQEHLEVLNYKTGIALSIVVFNFGTMLVLEIYTILTPGMKTLIYVSMAMSIVSWALIMFIPFAQAAKLTATCNKLRKTGHMIRAKAFAHQNVDPKELDSFLLFTASLNLRAKICLAPVKTSYISMVIVAVVFIVLILFQTGTINIWMKE